MAAKKNIIPGDHRNFLTVVCEGPPFGKTRTFICLCDCNKLTKVCMYDFLSGRVKSCGCQRRKLLSEHRIKHGHAIPGKVSREYHSWQAMHERCYRPDAKGYRNYGGRGIKVCDRWQTFDSFLEDMGPRPPGLTLDRIDVNGHYEKDNCRWATVSQQNLNRRPWKLKQPATSADGTRPDSKH